MSGRWLAILESTSHALVSGTFGVCLASVVWRDDTCQVDRAPWPAQSTAQDWAVASL